MRLAKLLADRFGIEPKLTGGARGIFDVHVNGKKYFSKDDDGQFPDEDEVLEELAGH